MGGPGDPNPYVNQASFSGRPQSPFVTSEGAPLYAGAPSQYSPRGAPSLYPPVQVPSQGPMNAAGGTSNNPYVSQYAPTTQTGGPSTTQTGGSEEVLVSVAGTIVHLVDEEESVLLGTGNFTVVRIKQQNEGIVALVRVGSNLQWPLMSDEQVVKLDPIHYVFSIPIVARSSEVSCSLFLSLG